MKKRDKAARRNKIIIGAILIIFMVSSLGSIVLYYGNPDSSTDKFTLDFDGREYSFQTKQDAAGNLYYEVQGDAAFTVFHTPEQLEFFEFDERVSPVLDSNFFYLTFDPGEVELTYADYIRFELMKNMPASKYFLEGISSESEIYKLPLVTCRNSSQAPVIFLRNSNSTDISVSNNCLEISYPQYQVLQIRDLLVYHANGVEVG